MTLLAHPVNPKQVYQNMLDKKDWFGGKYFHREIQQVAQSQGSGWVNYEFENPTSKQFDTKSTYVERADDLIICAGAYRTRIWLTPGWCCRRICGHGAMPAASRRLVSLPI